MPRKAARISRTTKKPQSHPDFAVSTSCIQLPLTNDESLSKSQGARIQNADNNDFGCDTGLPQMLALDSNTGCHGDIW